MPAPPCTGATTSRVARASAPGCRRRRSCRSTRRASAATDAASTKAPAANERLDAARATTAGRRRSCSCCTSSAATARPTSGAIRRRSQRFTARVRERRPAGLHARGDRQRLRQLAALHRPCARPSSSRPCRRNAASVDSALHLRVRPRRVARRAQPLPARPAVLHRPEGADAGADGDVAVAPASPAATGSTRVPARRAAEPAHRTTTCSTRCSASST